MSTPDGVYWASAFLLWAVTVFGAGMTWRWVRRLRAATAHTQAVAAERTELEKWARWTMLTIVDQDGTPYVTTIAQLHHSGLTERVWDNPIAASLWHADSQLYGGWQKEAERLLQTVEDTPPEETNGG